MMSCVDRKAAIIAVTMLILLAGAVADARSTLAAYLVAWIALTAIPIGALGVLMATYLVRRAWTEALHPVLTASAATLPIAGILLLPVLIWMGEIYPAVGEHASLPPFKAVYLAPSFFAFRAVVYFILWARLASWLRKAWGDVGRMTRAASAGLTEVAWIRTWNQIVMSGQF
jgi:hypothetical protein